MESAPVNGASSFWQSPLNRREAISGLALSLVLAVASVYTHLFGHPFFGVSDSGHYLMMASGDATVGQPFASRQLGPQMVRGIVALFHCTVPQAFAVQATLSLIVMLAVVFLLMLHARAPRWLIPVVATLPFLGEIYTVMALPDQFYAALLGLFLLLLFQQRYLWAAAMMFPLAVARESTLLTLACLLIANWAVLRWRGRLLAVFSFLAGTVVVKHLASESVGNVEKMPTMLYMLAKVPFNFMRAAGILPWATTMPLCAVPAWKHSIPFVKHLGANDAVGVCGFVPGNLLQWPVAACTTFGLLPLLTVMLWWKSRHRKATSTMMKFCLLYGTLSFVLAPVLGVWYTRMFGYGWPLFLVALPMLFQRFDRSMLQISAARGVALLLMELAICVVLHAPNYTVTLCTVPLIYAGAAMLLLPVVRQTKLVPEA